MLSIIEKHASFPDASAAGAGAELLMSSSCSAAASAASPRRASQMPRRAKKIPTAKVEPAPSMPVKYSYAL